MGVWAFVGGGVESALGLGLFGWGGQLLLRPFAVSLPSSVRFGVRLSRAWFGEGFSCVFGEHPPKTARFGTINRASPARAQYPTGKAMKRLHSNTMTRVGIVVGNFPLQSETFIVRLVDLLGRVDEVQSTVLVCGGYDVTAFVRSARGHPSLQRVQVVALNTATSLPAKAVALARTFVSARGNALRALHASAPAVVGLSDRGRAARLVQLIERYGPFDVLHAQFLTDARWLLPALRVGLLRRSRLLIASRGRDTTGPDSVGALECLKLIMAEKDVVLTPVARHLADTLIQRGIAAERIALVPSPIDTEAIPFVAPSRRGTGALKMLFVGRLVEKKGVDQLLRIFPDIIQRHPHAGLTIVGDGPMRQALARLVTGANLSRQVEFAGPLQHDRVIDLMLRSHVTVVPSRQAANGDSEGVPNVAKEAMAAGSIVVASNHGGLRNLIRDGVTGYSFEASRADLLRDAILRSIASQQSWDLVACEARKTVKAEYGYDQVRPGLLRALGHLGS